MAGALNLFVSDAITRKRVEAGMSIDELARLSGLTGEKLAEFEHDSGGMDFRSLQALADALGEDVASFFSGYVLARGRQDACDG